MEPFSVLFLSFLRNSKRGFKDKFNKVTCQMTFIKYGFKQFLNITLLFLNLFFTKYMIIPYSDAVILIFDVNWVVFQAYISLEQERGYVTEYIDNVCILYLSCNIKKPQTTAKCLKIADKHHSHRFVMVSYEKSALIHLPFSVRCSARNRCQK